MSSPAKPAPCQVLVDNFTKTRTSICQQNWTTIAQVMQVLRNADNKWEIPGENGKILQWNQELFAFVALSKENSSGIKICPLKYCGFPLENCEDFYERTDKLTRLPNRGYLLATATSSSKVDPTSLIRTESVPEAASLLESKGIYLLTDSDKEKIQKVKVAAKAGFKEGNVHLYMVDTSPNSVRIFDKIKNVSFSACYRFPVCLRPAFKRKAGVYWCEDCGHLKAVRNGENDSDAAGAQRRFYTQLCIRLLLDATITSAIPEITSYHQFPVMLANLRRNKDGVNFHFSDYKLKATFSESGQLTFKFTSSRARSEIVCLVPGCGNRVDTEKSPGGRHCPDHIIDKRLVTFQNNELSSLGDM